jgi:hypothetical protein
MTGGLADSVIARVENRPGRSDGSAGPAELPVKEFAERLTTPQQAPLTRHNGSTLQPRRAKT